MTAHMSVKTKINLAEKKILATISKDASPEEKLWASVLSQAIKDLSKNKKTREFDTARRYLLRQEIPAAERIGIDSSYVRRVFNALDIQL